MYNTLLEGKKERSAESCSVEVMVDVGQDVQAERGSCVEVGVENGVYSRIRFKSQLWHMLKFSGTIGKSFPV